VKFTTSEKKGQWVAPNGDLVNNNVRTDGKYPLGEQTLTVYGADSFEVEHDHNYAPPESAGAIKSYPCIQRNLNPPRTIDSFTEVTASFKFTAPDDAGGEWNRAFDVWTGKWGGLTGELMVWTDHKYNGTLPPKNAVVSDRPTIGGQRYIAWKRPLNPGDTRPYIAFVMDPLVAEGSVDLLAIFRWCVAKGWLKGTDTIAAFEYGVELANGAGKKRIHQLTNYTLTVK
jgi:hypothetical protein